MDAVTVAEKCSNFLNKEFAYLEHSKQNRPVKACIWCLIYR